VIITSVFETNESLTSVKMLNFHSAGSPKSPGKKSTVDDADMEAQMDEAESIKTR
jgi:hypothetical protein